MIRMLRIAALVSLWLAVSYGVAEAQSATAGGEDRFSNLLGISAGAEYLPVLLDPICGGSPRAPRGGSVVGGFVVVPVGRLGLEGRLAYHHQEGVLCTTSGDPRDGLVTVDSAAVGSGNFATLDLRLRLPVGVDNRWVFTLGGGWAPVPKDTGYLASSVGIRGGAGMRIGLDLELSVYRIRSVSRTVEYDQGVIVSRRPPEVKADWEPSFGFRLSVGVPVTQDQ